jgi:hypothetical protein
MASFSRVAREGITVGLLGAAGVAAWFFAVDVISGHMLYTPAVLGQAVMSLLGDQQPHSTLFYAAIYTPVHIAAFVLVGLIAARLVEASRQVPNLTAGFLLLFVVFETGFYFVSLFLAEFDTLGRLAWYQIGAANLLAAGMMGTYLWRKHPELKTELLMTLDERV